jgi:Lon protease-like protein
VPARGFLTSYSDLPATLPIFPLGGVLLLPTGRLPLSVFESRYLAMTDDALKSDRLIGIIQPKTQNLNSEKIPIIYSTGCAGRITAFSETDDGRYLITLSGIARFNVNQEIDSMRGYRRIVPDWEPYESDFLESDEIDLDKELFLKALKNYFEKKTIEADWSAIKRMNNSQLITTLAMICPFEPPEQQALLISDKMTDRVKTMISLLEMATHETGGAKDVQH